MAKISDCLEITLELHLVALHHSLATGEPRDYMHLIPGALEESRNENQLISIKNYCFFSLKLFLFRVKVTETHVVLEFEFYVHVWHLRYKYNGNTFSLLKLQNFVT